MLCLIILASLLNAAQATPTTKPTISPTVSKVPIIAPSVRPTVEPSYSRNPTLSCKPTLSPSWVGVNGVNWVYDVAGTANLGSYNISHNGGPATSASLNSPIGLWKDTNGLLYIADQKNSAVRTVDTIGDIRIFAGAAPSSGFTTDIAATSALLSASVNTMMGDTNGNIYITDTGNNCIRAVDTTKTLWTVVNTGCKNYTYSCLKFCFPQLLFFLTLTISLSQPMEILLPPTPTHPLQTLICRRAHQ